MYFPLFLLCAQAIAALELDPSFSVDHRKLQLDELSKTVRELNTAVMGIAELIVEIDRNVKYVYSSVATKQQRSLGVKGERSIRNEILARKAEKLLAMKDNPVAEKAREELEKQIEYNFLKALGAILVTGPVRAQERQNEILKIMQSTLNGEVNFKPVVERLPFLMREQETTRFIELLKTLRESERKGYNPSRQLGGLQNIDKILDAASKINIKEVGGFLKEIPEIFAGVESIVSGVDEHLTDLSVDS